MTTSELNKCVAMLKKRLTVGEYASLIQCIAQNPVQLLKAMTKGLKT